jgi:hypothetical protein
MIVSRSMGECPLSQTVATPAQTEQVLLNKSCEWPNETA